MNNFQKLDYELPVTNIGDNYSAEKWGEKEAITFKKGDNFNFKCSSALYNKLVDYSKGELVDITMVATDKGVTYRVAPSMSKWDKPVYDEGVTSKPYGYDSVKNRDNDRSLEIKWGMAFNNATRLVNYSKMPYEDKVEAIEKMMPKMFEIACSMKYLTKTEAPKVVKEDDDAPF
tara:strand:+ start:7041 stop:7562 length:522 start_codon:yes stop_codon:yes gene_type:complete